MLLIPLSPVPAQTLAITLDGQSCNISVYVKSTGMFFDLQLGTVSIKSTVIVRDAARLVLDAQYLGFIGDFLMVDTQGSTDPVYTGLGTRYALIYLQAADVAQYV